MRTILLVVGILLSIQIISCTSASEPEEKANSGLTVNYSNGVNKVETVILHGWGANCNETGNNFYQGECMPVDASPVDWAWGNFEATWRGSIYIPAKGDYTFSAWVDGTVYIAINDSVVADFNTVGSAYTKILSFGAADWYPISMKFVANGGSNYMHLGWVRPGAAYETVPAKNMRPE